jgi:hypothetical protein
MINSGFPRTSGGPFFKRDKGHWTIPKGDWLPGESLSTAVREFKEKQAFNRRKNFFPPGSIRQRGGKVVHTGFRRDSREDVHQCIFQDGMATALGRYGSSGSGATVASSRFGRASKMGHTASFSGPIGGVWG